MKFCFIDCETTGTDPDMCALVQWAGKIVIDGKIVETFDIRAAPFDEDVIDLEALKVNGLTEMIIRSYLTPRTAYMDFIDVLKKHCDKYDKTDKIHFVGWNADFDADFVRAFMKKNGDPYFGSWFWFPILDISKLAGMQLAHRRHELFNFKLITVAQFIGIEVDESKTHDAMYDIDLTIEIFKRLARSMPNGIRLEIA